MVKENKQCQDKKRGTAWPLENKDTNHLNILTSERTSATTKPGAQQYQQRWSVAGAAQWVHYAKDSPNKDMEIGLFVTMGHYPSEFPMGELIEPTKMKIKRETFVEHEKRMSPNKTKVEKETSVKQEQARPAKTE